MISGIFQRTYRVEVSGWDTEERFFVEKTELEWGEKTGKRVCLKHSLRARAIIFVRLLQATMSNPACPVAYETEALPAELDGQARFQLVQLGFPVRDKVERLAEKRDATFEEPTQARP
ncbi:MAG: hypothetical protein NVS9B4_22640 [Candidatus Acidiferrum sp.]